MSKIITLSSLSQFLDNIKSVFATREEFEENSKVTASGLVDLNDRTVSVESELDTNVVKCVTQELTDEQKSAARENIGAIDDTYLTEQLSSYYSKTEIDDKGYVTESSLSIALEDLENADIVTSAALSDLNNRVTLIDESLITTGDGTKYLSDDGSYKKFILKTINGESLIGENDIIIDTSNNVYNVSSLVESSNGSITWKAYDIDGNEIEFNGEEKIINDTCNTVTLDKVYQHLSYYGIYGDTMFYVTDPFNPNIEGLDKLEMYYNGELIASTGYKFIVTDLGYVVGAIYDNMLYLVSGSTDDILTNSNNSSIFYTNAFKTTCCFGDFTEFGVGNTFPEQVAIAMTKKLGIYGSREISPIYLSWHNNGPREIVNVIHGTLQNSDTILLKLFDGTNIYNIQLSHDSERSLFVVDLFEKTSLLTRSEVQEMIDSAIAAAITNTLNKEV